MNLRTIQLVYLRELRDQLRDRRTLFTVLVLPILIYPVLGLAMWQVAQLSSPETCRIWVLGAEHLPTDLRLIEGNRFAPNLLGKTEQAITEVIVEPYPPHGYPGPLRKYWSEGDDSVGVQLREWLRQQLILRGLDLVVLIPVKPNSEHSKSSAPIQIVQTSSRSSSVAAAERAQSAIQAWSRQMIVENLGRRQIEVTDVKPFAWQVIDLANPDAVSALKWSKTLPLLFVIWALTGAFYPAVDLCAGEKERGTLETLLSSPAARIDIIGGKLLTVMSFSVITAVLNVVSLGVSAAFVLGTSAYTSPLGQAIGLSLPPLFVIPILLVGLLPIAGLFSALAFAVAAFARSSKEGQYYLMPLLMVTFPLLILPMLPGIQLSMGTSLIPVSGLILLMHTLIEGNVEAAATFFGPVIAVTLVGCGLAVKWSIHQFNDEGILFRTSDPVSLWTWLKYIWRRRGPQPTMALAIFCAASILIAKFFSTFSASPPQSVDEFWQQAIRLLVLAVALPAIVFALVTTRQPWLSLGIRRPAVWQLTVAALLAAFLHPAMTTLSHGVIAIFPLHAPLEGNEEFLAFFEGASGLVLTVLVLCLAPAICEELAFRGFILNGFRAATGPLSAILATSFLFGLAHSVLQQSIITFFVGLVVGFIAVRCGSIFPCIVFHALHNLLTIGMSRVTEGTVQASAWLDALMQVEEGHVVGYHPWAVVSSGLCAAILILILLRNPALSVAGWNHRLRQTTAHTA